EYRLALTDFGTVRFTAAQATSTGGHSGAIRDGRWKAQRVYFLSTHGGADPGSRFVAEANAAHVIPSQLSTAGDTFTATWHDGRPGDNDHAKPSAGGAI